MLLRSNIHTPIYNSNGTAEIHGLLERVLSIDAARRSYPFSHAGQQLADTHVSLEGRMLVTPRRPNIDNRNGLSLLGSSLDKPVR